MILSYWTPLRKVLVAQRDRASVAPGHVAVPGMTVPHPASSVAVVANATNT